MAQQQLLHDLQKRRGMTNGKRKRRSPSLYIPPEFVSWLSNNYVVNSEESVPKDSIYRRYVQHCREMEVVPKKSNIFGKMLKKMFPNIRPRRLGSAGNMVAHYAGITLRQPGRPCPPATTDPNELRRSNRYRKQVASGSASGADSPNDFSVSPDDSAGEDEEDYDQGDENGFCSESPFSGCSSSFSEPNSPSSAVSPTLSSSCASYSTTHQAQFQHKQQQQHRRFSSCPSPASDSSSPFSGAQYTYFTHHPQPQQTQSPYLSPSSGMAYAPAPTFSYASPNQHSFLSSLNPRADAEIGLLAGDGMEDEVFQFRTKVMEERETIEEEEFEEGDTGMEYLLNFPLEVVEPAMKKPKQEGEESEPTGAVKAEGENHDDNHNAAHVDTAMLEACLNTEDAKQQPQQTGAGKPAIEGSDGSNGQTSETGASTHPLEMVLVDKSQEQAIGNESECGTVMPCVMDQPSQQSIEFYNIDTPALGGQDYHLNKLSQLKKYMCIFARQIWLYAPITNRVMDDRTVEYYVLSEGRQEQSVRSLCVKFALYMGALYCENFQHAKEYYIAARDTLSYVFDVLDLDVALILLHMAHTTHIWYEKDEADALAFNYISAAISLCQAAKAFNSETYRKCVEYEGWLALRTGPSGQKPLRPYHPPPAHYKIVGKPIKPQQVDAQLVLDDTISILINVMNILKFFDLHKPINGVTLKDDELSTDKQQDNDPRLLRLKENMRILQKQLEMCYNTICQVEASGGFSFEAAFRPKFWLISIVSSVHLTMGEREKGLNAALLAVKSLEKWLSLSGSLWGCGVMFDYIADSLDTVGDAATLDCFISMIEKQKYYAAQSTQSFVKRWRQQLADKKV